MITEFYRDQAAAIAKRAEQLTKRASEDKINLSVVAGLLLQASNALLVVCEKVEGEAIEKQTAGEVKSVE